jgi:hypothetical protein
MPAPKPPAFESACTKNLNPNVLTMKSAQYGARIYDAGSLNLARDRGANLGALATCVYRKLKPGRSDGEARRGSGVNE